MTDPLDLAFAALAHPTRRAILDRLCTGEATVNELAEPFEMSLPAVSRHLRVLEDAGLITRGRKAQTRPCRINPDALARVAAWAEGYRPIWELRFDTMANLLAAEQESDDD
ncbi:helix-turn-helix transcriptional regulator [Jannaschia sp. M317]|uniref:ArsR/SmtB family transcription factor n=1 Tax=Jannaschia sp. M317 TaxID=2867011 RepID=UPI0021A484E3|nr:metalloregulator ArsR/SmtB family transcription factor [Jannaschia sp. M317]UWQ17679.1 metalloregulator ArsR/SmtB family transcription factor [Jannaschia sp. M317]